MRQLISLRRTRLGIATLGVLLATIAPGNHPDARAETFSSRTGAVDPGGDLDTADYSSFVTGIDQIISTTGESRPDESPLRVLEKIHGHLTTLIDTGRYTEHEARARSVAARALDVIYPHSLTTLKGFARFIDMKPSRYWKMFIDVAQWKNHAMAFDREKSPGYYAAMTRAFTQYVKDAAFQVLQRKAAAIVDWNLYDEMHKATSNGVLRLDGRSGQPEPVPHVVSERGTTFPVTGDITSASGPELADLARSLKEMWGDSIARWAPDDLEKEWGGAINVRPLPRSVAEALPLADIARATPSTSYIKLYSNGRQIIAVTGYEKDQQPVFVTAQLAMYYQSIEHADPYVPKDQWWVRYAICKLVRNLHVGHIYKDGNGRLNTMLLLNYLLVAAKQSPSIVEDTSVFGGAVPIEKLVDLVEKGQERFQDEVGEDRFL